MPEAIWYRDIESFFGRDNLGKIYFQKHDSIETKLNVIFRWSLYYSVLVCVLARQSWPIGVAIAVAVITYSLYSSSVDVRAPPDDRTDVPPRPKETVGSAEADDVKPTFHNPYMNRLAFDDKTTSPMDSDKLLRPDTQAEILDMHDAGVPHDVCDVYGRNSSERAFYTIPTNDQASFARWLFRPSEDVTFKERAVLFHR